MLASRILLRPCQRIAQRHAFLRSMQSVSCLPLKLHLPTSSTSHQIELLSSPRLCILGLPLPRSYSATAKPESDATDSATVGGSEKLQFQTETQKLLGIVANALYSDKEIFLRELISNASDALEKLRYLSQVRLEGVESSTADSSALNIHVRTNDVEHTLTVEDNGVGMTREEMIKNLGTIAKSGSAEFLSNLRDGDKSSDTNAVNSIIGQFGVGFYASFMVSDKVEVISRPHRGSKTALRWVSDGHSGYEISELSPDAAEARKAPARGTKIVLYLKKDCQQFDKEDVIESILKKYSNFVGYPVTLNSKRVNVLEPLWTKDPSQVTEQEHEEFFRYIGGSPVDKPRYVLWYKADAPINVRALLYTPLHKPSVFEMSRDAQQPGVALYCRKVMIQHRNQTLLPKWLRFLRGVIDSEDIPLNLSRELLQDSALIRQLSRVLTSKIIKFFKDQSKRDSEKYAEFHQDYGLFFKEGIVTTPEQDVREDIARLLRFESSAKPAGELVSLTDYSQRMKAGERNIYYICAKRRDLAEGSPYFEALKKKDPNAEVLFLYEAYDELVLMQLSQFERKHLVSVESELVQDSKDESHQVDPTKEGSITQEQADQLSQWLQNDALQGVISKARVTHRLSQHPCVVHVKDAAIVRHHLRTSTQKIAPQELFKLIDPILELNPTHSLVHAMVRMHKGTEEEVQIAKLLAQQLLDNAMVQAELLDDARSAVGSRLNDLLTRMAEKMVKP